MVQHDPDTLAAGLRLASWGLPVHWLRSPHGGLERGRGKAPIARGWQSAPCADQAQLQATFTPGLNIGLRTGVVAGARRALVAIDFDGAEALRWGRLHLPQSPIRTRTGPDREHWFFARPAGGIRNSVGSVPGVDVRGDQGQVVVAPSVHPGTLQPYAEAEPWTPELLDACPLFDEAWFPPPSARKVVTFLAEAAPAVAGARGHDQFFRVALQLFRRFRLTREEAIALIAQHYNPRCTPPWSEDEIAHKVDDAIKLIGVKETTRVRASLTAVVSAISDGEWAGVIATNSLRKRVVCLKDTPWGPPREWGDVDDARCACWLEQNGLSTTTQLVRQAVSIVAANRMVHPVQQYLESLAWDGIPRLAGMLATYFCATDTRYTQLVATWWMISAVARAMRPGCKVDHALILEGAQAAKKSTALGVLAVHREWFVDSTLPLGDKSAYELIGGKWIVEFAELESWRKVDQRKLKAFISSDCDTYRPPYGHYVQDHPRQCVFAGTTNESQYLDDPTGARRFWPVQCGSVDLDSLRADRDQLWAEAAARYKAGERWWPEGDEVRLCSDVQEDRQIGDDWYDVVAAWLLGAGAQHAVDGAESLTMQVVLQEALGLDVAGLTRAARTRVGVVLTRLGLTRCRRTDGDRSYYYARRAR